MTQVDPEVAPKLHDELAPPSKPGEPGEKPATHVSNEDRLEIENATLKHMLALAEHQEAVRAVQASAQQLVERERALAALRASLSKKYRVDLHTHNVHPDCSIRPRQG